MRLGYLSLAATLLLLPAENHAQDAEPQCSASGPAVCFARDVVLSLTLAHLGALHPDTAGANGNVLILAQATMYAAKQQELAIEKAQAYVSPYLHAKDSTIATSARYFLAAYSELAAFQNASVAALKSHLDGTSASGVGSTAEEMATLAMRRNEAAKALIAAVGEAAAALVRTDPATGRSSALAMTTDERSDLLDRLRTNFGDTLKSLPNGQYASDYASAAATLYRTIADPRWRLQPDTRR
jgi:hypothetical protein